MDRTYDYDAVAAAVSAVREENARLCAEADEMRGALKESRRVCRRMRRECAEAQRKAARDAAYWRQLLVAAVGMAVALTSLLHSVILAVA